MSAPRLSRTFLAAVTVALALGGCDDDGVSPVARALERAEARWEAQALSHYTVETRVLCFCVPVVSRWHEITVAGDSVIAVRRVEPGSDEGNPATVHTFRSVEAVFASARRWPGEERGNRLDGVFDPVTGLPVRLDFFTGPHIADGGATVEFRALKPGLTARVAP